MNYNEDEHPRGDDGRWIKKGTSPMLQKYEYRAKIARVTKQEWRIYYKIIAGELRGDFVYRATDKERWVRIDTKILIDNGEFITPKVNSVIEFASNDIMNDFLEEMLARGIIHNE
ncbi:MAG: hypothetical protein IKA59_00870 [Clostridia bacterium]|nr:hypothetical protein [Clostridia bacterium]